MNMGLKAKGCHALNKSRKTKSIFYANVMKILNSIMSYPRSLGNLAK